MPSKHRPKHSAPRKFARSGPRQSEKRSARADLSSSLSDGTRRSPASDGDRDSLERETLKARRGLFEPDETSEAPRLSGTGDPANRDGSPPRTSRQDKPSGEDFWNDPLPPRRRSTGEGRQRDQGSTSVMEASFTQSPPEAEPRSFEEPRRGMKASFTQSPPEAEPRSFEEPRRPRASKASKPKTTRIASTDPLPSERLRPARTSSLRDHEDPSEPKRPYATGKFSRKDRHVPEEEPPAAKMSRRKARKAAAAERGEQSQSLGQWFKEITILGVVAVGTAVLLTTYLIQAFFIPSASMENTLTKDDRVLVNKFTYKFGKPKLGDIIVFVSPEGAKAPPPANTPYARFMDRVAIAIGLKSSEQDLIKRVIATEGQTIEAKLGLVFVNGRQLVEPYRKDTDPISDIPAQKVPGGHVFVLGDNRADSRDSRVFGPVPVSSIIGKAFARIWPIDRLTWFKF